MAKILLVEDDQALASNVKSALLFEHHQVELVEDGNEAADMMRLYQFDLVVLDWELPGKTGPEICKEYRSQGGQAPILMLTGRGSASDKEAGLDAGGDDYLTKPFNMKEFLARIRALLRRPPQIVDNVLTAGNISLDPKKRRVHKDGQPVVLVPKEYALLEFLMRHPNQVFTPEALLNHVWPSDSEATVLALRSTLKRLRSKIDPDGTMLQTQHGVGYILEIP